MPWEGTTVNDQRARFVLEYNRRVRTGETTMSALCAEYGVSRKTGHKYWQRFKQFGLVGLLDFPRAPQRIPHREAAASWSKEDQARLPKRWHMPRGMPERKFESTRM